MSKVLKNKVDSIRRTLKNNGLELSGTAIEEKILEMYPNYESDWSSDNRIEVIKAFTKDHQVSEIVSSIVAPLSESLTQLQEAEPFVQQEIEDIEDEEINIVHEEELKDTLSEINQDNQSLAVTNTDKQALVSTQSLALGFELSEQECLVVADSVDDVFNDYSSFLTSVTTAIKGYIDHRFNEVESALDTNADAVRSHIADRATKLNQKVENFSTNVKADIGGIRQNIKSSKANILSRFALPSKTG
jgi:dipeptidyl aminopeptidase/acylaminoacyl peptidase